MINNLEKIPPEYLILISSSIYALIPFLHSNVVKTENIKVYTTISYMCSMFILIFFLLFLLNKGEINEIFTKKSGDMWKYAMITTCLASLAYLASLHAIKKYNVSKMKMLGTSFGVMTTLILGYCIYNDKLNKYNLLGVATILIGVYLVINY